MSETPTDHRPNPAANPAGDGVELNVTQARGGQRTGRVVWIMAISMGVLILLFAGFLVLNAGHMQALNHPAGRDLNAHDATSYQVPPPSPREVPPPSGRDGAGANTGG